MADKAPKTFELIYSDQQADYIRGRAYSNPRFFTSARSGVTKVLLVGDWPAVEAAYKAQGVEVEHVSAASVLADPAVAELPAGPAPVSGADRVGVKIPEAWRDLPWKGGEQTLRSLATSLSGGPVLNKAQAAQVIEAEVARRADGTGLTRVEIDADLEAMGVEVDPVMTDAEALAVRSEARAERDAG